MLPFAEHLTLMGYKLLVNACTLVIGLLGNIIVCIVIACNRSLHTLTDFYLLNLSITDLLTLITKFLSDFYYYQALAITKPSQHGTNSAPEGYVFNDRAADYITIWITFTALYASVLTVAAFTVERYLAICRPFFAQSMSKTSRVKAIIVAIWSIGALFASMLVATRVLRAGSNDWKSTTVRFWNYAEGVLHCLCFIMPNLAITVMCILIGRELKRSSVERPTTRQTNRSNAKALKMFAMIIVISFLSWTPFLIVMLLLICSPTGKYWYHFAFNVTYVGNITYTLPSALNPVIYTIMSRKFREALKDFLSKTWKKLDCRTPVLTSTQSHETNLEMTQSL